MGDTYNLIVQEDDSDLGTLGINNYQLQVAKSVASPPDSAPIFNVVYTSALLAPNMSVSWQTQYGLNWTTEIPAKGAKVEYFGRWQAVDLGQSYGLDKEGLWFVDNSNPYANSSALNVGANNYQDVHIVVGIHDPTQGWLPIYVNEDKLIKFAHGEYQPIEAVRVWYEDDNRSSTIITGQGTDPFTFNLSADVTYYFWFNTETGKWHEQNVPFPFNLLPNRDNA